MIVLIVELLSQKNEITNPKLFVAVQLSGTPFRHCTIHVLVVDLKYSDSLIPEKQGVF